MDYLLGKITGQEACRTIIPIFVLGNNPSFPDYHLVFVGNKFIAPVLSLPNLRAEPFNQILFPA
jgi:hypothetical protein